MARFFGLFGSKTKYVDEAEPEDNRAAAPDQKTEDFFLSSDDAKTLGNVDFMRQSKTIKKTFPKTKGNPNTELVQQVSSMEKVKVAGNQAFTDTPAPTPTPKSETGQTAEVAKASTERRRTNSSMDMFRNMARELKK